MTTTMTLSRIRRELARLVAGERTPEAEGEARLLVAEYRAVQARQRRPELSAAEVAAAERWEENKRWQRTLSRIGRGGGAASTVVWRPGGGREGEPVWTRRNEAKTHLRKSSPWR